MTRAEGDIKNVSYFYDYVSLLLSHMNIVLEYKMNLPCVPGASNVCDLRAPRRLRNFIFLMQFSYSFMISYERG